MASDRAYVWTWLGESADPVVAGVVEPSGGRFAFAYARSYLERAGAISLYSRELPLSAGTQYPLDGLDLAGCLADGTPDGWGRGVIDADAGATPGSMSEIDYMLRSGSNRFGAIDFQAGRDQYTPRRENASLEDLLRATELLEARVPLPAALASALLHGTSIGGARPKATITADGLEYIAKFPSSTDAVFPVVNAEAAAMMLAAHVGLDVAAVQLVHSNGKDVLLVERFDRVGGRRVHAVSALTMLGLSPMTGRYATYPDLLDVLRATDSRPGVVGRELFLRIAFNMAISNSDDHARNHAALWNGSQVRLSPAFDLAPNSRTGETASQAMAYGRDGERRSTFAALIDECSIYGLTRAEARRTVDDMVSEMHLRWPQVADEARLAQRDRERLWRHLFLNPGVFNE